MKKLTQSRMRELFDYDGRALIWRERPLRTFKTGRHGKAWNTRYAGTIAGTLNRNGRIYVNIGRHRHPAHRIIFLREYGWLPKEIDHINHNPNDNRLSNLRHADRTINCRNAKLFKTNTSGRVGVAWRQDGNIWRAYIWANGRQMNIGHFDDFDAACAARSAAETTRGFHPNHGH